MVRKLKPQQVGYWKSDTICVGQMKIANGSLLPRIKVHTENKFHFVIFSFIILVLSLDKHVSLSIMHLENEPTIQKLIAQAENTTEPKCMATINVSLLGIFFSSILAQLKFFCLKLKHTNHRFMTAHRQNHRRFRKYVPLNIHPQSLAKAIH